MAILFSSNTPNSFVHRQTPKKKTRARIVTYSMNSQSLIYSLRLYVLDISKKKSREKKKHAAGKPPKKRVVFFQPAGVQTLQSLRVICTTWKSTSRIEPLGQLSKTVDCVLK
ncbi:hypothetical protein GJ744_007698 [Endocarpon pusillum]|uniref:Uncharacterized protein n=1 Tax=Endocarpon pusillum TaxID=364733 RepID=A0A8H7ASQ7_9EURO|nr:hypothetical protein GJ744_007698 [Endocarpon pusillum]